MSICQLGMHKSVQDHTNANVCKQTYDASCTSTRRSTQYYTHLKSKIHVYPRPNSEAVRSALAVHDGRQCEDRELERTSKDASGSDQLDTDWARNSVECAGSRRKESKVVA